MARFFRGIRPAVVALIAAPVFRMAKSARVTRHTVWIPVAAALLIWLAGVSPIYIILVAGLGGYAYGQLINDPEDKADEKPASPDSNSHSGQKA